MDLLQPHHRSPAAAPEAAATSGGTKAQERPSFNICSHTEFLVLEMMLWASLDNEGCVVLVMEGDVFRGYEYALYGCISKAVQEKKTQNVGTRREFLISYLKNVTLGKQTENQIFLT